MRKYKAGKRYWRVDGLATGPLETVVDPQPEFVFRDPISGLLYNEDGLSNQVSWWADLGIEYKHKEVGNGI